MANRLSKLQPLIYVPAVSAVTARAAYCVGGTSRRSFSGFGLSGGGHSSVQPGGEDTSLTADTVALLKSGYSAIKVPDNYSPYAPTAVSDKVCFPAVPGRAAAPARYDYVGNFGWNAGARSVAQVPPSGYFRGTLPPSPVGVQIGLCGRSFGHTYSEMQHSVVVRRDQLTVVELGSTVFGPITVPPSTVIEVRRQGGVVTYSANGAVVYTSTVPSAGERYAGTVVYSPGDYVDSPSIGTVIAPVNFAANQPSLVAAIADVSDHNIVRSAVPPLMLTAQLDLVTGAIRFKADLPAMVSAISTDTKANWMRGELQPSAFSATLSQVEELPNGFIVVIPPMLLTTRGMAGQALSFSAELPFAFAAANIASYNRMNAYFPLRITTKTQIPYFPADVVEGSDAALAYDSHTLESALLLLAYDSLDLSGSAELVVVIELSGMDGANLGDTASIGSLVEMLAMEQVAIVSKTSTAQQQALQYAVNYITGALTTYKGFDFSGFTYHDGRAYAWRSDGLYGIGGGDDNGSAIQALVDFGTTDYGDALLKRAESAYLGVRTDGECYLRIYADDKAERVYKLVGDGNERRALLAKGVTSRFWSVRLEMTDATFATVDNLEVRVGLSQRRTISRRP